MLTASNYTTMNGEQTDRPTGLNCAPVSFVHHYTSSNNSINSHKYISTMVHKAPPWCTRCPNSYNRYQGPFEQEVPTEGQRVLISLLEGTTAGFNQA